MTDVRLARLAGRQRNRIALRQLHALGFTDRAIAQRLKRGRLVRRRDGVFAVAPVLDDPDGYRMELTLTAPETSLCRVTGACAWGVLSREPPLPSVVRPGSGGPRTLDGMRVYRSTTLAAETTTVRGIPVTTIERTLLDLATAVGDRALARAVRESVRLELTDLADLGDALGRFQRRRGTIRLAACVARYSGLPLERARSGAEIRALELLRDEGRPMADLNLVVAGEEADLVWRDRRLIVELDGGPFHMDVGEDRRKQGKWEAAGWVVRRLASDRVYDSPWSLLDLAPTA